MYYSFLVSILLLTTTPTIVGWGREGHFITTRIALAYLDSGGRDFVDRILQSKVGTVEDAFYEASIWPDTVQADPKYDWARPMHFVNTPDRLCDGVKLKRDCGSLEYPGYCPVTAIANYTSRLADETLAMDQRREAFKFLVHFLADANQPLHIGFKGDKGGNKLMMTPPWDHPVDKAGKRVASPRAKPLHVQWDGHVIQYTYKHLGLDWMGLADAIISRIEASKISWANDWHDPLSYATTSVIQSSHLACTVAYKSGGKWVKDGQRLSRDYYEDAAATSIDQLMKSGLDIARSLNQIAYEIKHGDDTGSTDGGMSDESDALDEDFDWENAAFSVDYEDEFLFFGP